jgi:hypothetical protein
LQCNSHDIRQFNSVVSCSIIPMTIIRGILFRFGFIHKHIRHYAKAKTGRTKTQILPLSCVCYVFQVPGSTPNPSQVEKFTTVYHAINYHKPFLKLRGLCGCDAWHPYICSSYDFFLKFFVHYLLFLY